MAVRAFRADVFVVTDPTKLLDTELVEVRVFHVNLLLKLELTHLSVFLLKTGAEPLGIDATAETAADIALDAPC